MAVSKVILNGDTLIDVTQKTVTSASMLSGTTALKNDGTDITGSIASKTSSDLTASGATVTAPAGYYASSASKSVTSGSATTPATSITANPTISVGSDGLITATVHTTKSITPTVSAGYVSSGTAGTATVSGSATSQLTTQAAQTIHPSTTDQTIASGKYLTGAQTVKGVLLTNLSAGNIKKDVVVKVGDSTDDDCVTSVTGTYDGSGGGGTGLEYETGEYTPSEDVSLYYVYFTNAHASAPMYYAVADVTSSSVQTYSNFAITYTNFESAFGGGGAVTTSAIMYGLVGLRYNSGSDTSSTGTTNLITVPLAQSDGSTSSHPTFWATNERIKLNTTSNSRYFHAGRTYKWIAVWPPTT